MGADSRTAGLRVLVIFSAEVVISAHPDNPGLALLCQRFDVARPRLRQLRSQRVGQTRNTNESHPGVTTTPSERWPNIWTPSVLHLKFLSKTVIRALSIATSELMLSGLIGSRSMKPAGRDSSRWPRRKIPTMRVRDDHRTLSVTAWHRPCVKFPRGWQCTRIPH